jgi:hypothetical protein
VVHFGNDDVASSASAIAPVPSPPLLGVGAALSSAGLHPEVVTIPPCAVRVIYKRPCGHSMKLQCATAFEYANGEADPMECTEQVRIYIMCRSFI